MAAEYVGSGSDDGSILGRSGGKIGFFAATPVVVQTASTTMVASTATTTSIATEVNKLTAALTNLGLIA
jgi:hypothetical protein